MYSLTARLLPVFIEVILPLAVIWEVGYLGRKFLRLDPRPFSRAGLYILTPTVIFSSLMSSRITAEEGSRIVAVVFLLTGSLWVLSSLQTKLLHLCGEDRSAFSLTAMFINVVNYGFPVTYLAFGEAGLERAAVFAIGHGVLSNTIGAYIAAQGRAGSIREALRQVLRIPMLYAVLLALILRLAGVSLTASQSFGGIEIALIPSIYSSVRMLAQASVPIFMLILGMQLGNNGNNAPSSNRFSWPLFFAGFTRLIVSPGIAWLFTLLLGLQDLAARVTILEAAMSSAVLTVILATEFEARPQFVTRVVAGTTLVSMLTLTVLLSVLGGVR